MWPIRGLFKVDIKQRLTRPAMSAIAASQETAQVEFQTIEQTMERLPNGTRRLAAQLRTSINPEKIWDVLTDYEKLNEFIPNLSSSELINRTGSRVHLRQIGSQKFVGMKFSAKVEIELIEKPADGDLEFHLIKGDFRRFEGAWRIKPLGKAGSCILYELTVQGCLGMPVGLIEQRLKKDLSANLLAVEKEAIKRNLKK